MRPWLLVPFLAVTFLAGCAEEPGPAAAPAADERFDLDLAPDDPQGHKVVFDVPASEQEMSGTETFSIAAQCFFECQAGGESLVDLTPVIPADAPVELIVTVYGANSRITYTDTFASGIEDGALGDYDGQKAEYAGLVVRAATGTVTLHVYNPGGFEIPPNPAPTADWEARSVVRPDRLVAGMPASLPLTQGDALGLSDADNIEQAILIGPDGALVRDLQAPFVLVANATGEHVVLMLGSDSTSLLGPEVTLTARRFVYEVEEPRPIDGPTSWTFTPTGQPVQVALVLGSRDGPVATPFFGGAEPGSHAMGYTFTVMGPTGARVLDLQQNPCQPFCAFFQASYVSDYFHEGLRLGDYAVDLQFQGRGAQAAMYAVVVA